MYTERPEYFIFPKIERITRMFNIISMDFVTYNILITLYTINYELVDALHCWYTYCLCNIIIILCLWISPWTLKLRVWYAIMGDALFSPLVDYRISQLKIVNIFIDLVSDMLVRSRASLRSLFTNPYVMYNYNLNNNTNDFSYMIFAEFVKFSIDPDAITSRRATGRLVLIRNGLWE